jgi:hypothetical protein
VSTIPFDRDLAKEFQRELSPMMYEWEDEPSRYVCRFCYRYCYSPKAGETKLNEIKHSDDCLGMRLMKELDSKL